MSYPATEMELAKTSRNFAATLAKFLLMDAIVEPFLGGASCNFGLLRRAGEVPKRNQPLLGYASICAYADIIETSPPRGALMAFAENLSPYGARTTSRKTSLPKSFTSPAKP